MIWNVRRECIQYEGGLSVSPISAHFVREKFTEIHILNVSTSASGGSWKRGRFQCPKTAKYRSISATMYEVLCLYSSRERHTIFDVLKNGKMIAEFAGCRVVSHQSNWCETDVALSVDPVQAVTGEYNTCFACKNRREDTLAFEFMCPGCDRSRERESRSIYSTESRGTLRKIPRGVGDSYSRLSGSPVGEWQKRETSTTRMVSCPSAISARNTHVLLYCTLSCVKMIERKRSTTRMEGIAYWKDIPGCFHMQSHHAPRALLVRMSRGRPLQSVIVALRSGQWIYLEAPCLSRW